MAENSRTLGASEPQSDGEEAKRPNQSMNEFEGRWSLQYIIDQHNAGDADFRTELEDDEGLPSEVPSSFRYNTADIAKGYWRKLLSEALGTALRGHLEFDALLAGGSLYEMYRRYVGLKRGAGHKPLTYASFLYQVINGQPPLGGGDTRFKPDEIAEHLTAAIIAAMEAGNFDALAKLKIGPKRKCLGTTQKNEP